MPRARPAPPPPPTAPPLLAAGSAATAAAERWFAARGWRPFDFQREVWAAMAAGHGGLLHATTGSGKTLAAWLGALARDAVLHPVPAGAAAPPLRVLWITPMRALAADSVRALQAPLTGDAAVAPGWTVGLRTGDTPSSERARQDRRLPPALVTTPESLSLMLTRADAAQRLAGVHTVVVDEWHELLASKRGVQVQLALARLRAFRAAAGAPPLVAWGLSATLGNLDEAQAALAGPGESGCRVRGRLDKSLVIDTLLPAEPGRFSWAGHLGAQMAEPVVREIESQSRAGGTTLVFTNVRSQAEAWYQMLLDARPDWAGEVALHHGSLDRAVRDWVEAGLKAGTLRAVVATSSLDLGVDFLPVERVMQIGSAKGVARLLQRAGRSGHAPGRASRVTLVPTNTLELVEAVAARRAALAGRVEARPPPHQPLDVLVQHLVTVALGGGFPADPRPGTPDAITRDAFTSDALYAEVRGAYSYRDLSREAFDWAIDFVTRGGASLGAYPEYHRVVVVPGDDGRVRFGVTDRGIAHRHRMSVGTIVGEASIAVKWLTGGTLGTVEEGFIARLSPGDHFVFGGRVLEFVRVREMAAYVRRATKKRGIVPAWAGGRMPLSSELADATLEVLDGVRQGDLFDPELRAAAPMLDAQTRLSRLPTPSTLLVEAWTSREGHHVFVYPFACRPVHLGLASLVAWRLSRTQPNTWSISVNDHGFELLAAQAPDWSALRDGRVWATDDLLDHVMASLNSGELAQRRFREIARVAGLVNTGYPGERRSARQLQASSSLFYEVFRQYDAGNLLLAQAQREVLSQELELTRLTATLRRLARHRLEWVDLPCPSPFALPLMVERLREQLSTEKLADRLKRIVDDATARLDAPSPAAPHAHRAGRRGRGRTMPS